MAVIDDLITDRTAEDVTNKTKKGFYNASDLNRIGEAVSFLNSEFRRVGITANAFPRTDWTSSDIPTQADFEPISLVLTGIKGAYLLPSEWDVPTSLSGLDYKKANAIELVLKRVNELTGKNVSSYVYCGDFYCGG